MRKSPKSPDTLDAHAEDVFARLADGEPVGKIAESLGLSRASAFKWRDAGGPERRARWDAALTEAAHAHAERAGQILEEGRNPKTTAEAQMTKERANHERWLAERRDRLSYGAEGFRLNVGIVGDIGQLHLDALRAKGSVALHGPKAPLVLEGRTEPDDSPPEAA